MTGLLTALLLLFQNPTASTCKWSAAVQIGTLDHDVDESSGMAVSRKIPNRSYRHNDSGDSGRFFVMGLAGGKAKGIHITGFAPVDVEDMAIGPCDSTTDCLFFGDIGDNSRKRRDLELVVVRERATFPEKVAPDYRVILRYPDGPHDAEALGVHPNGDVYIITKDPTTSQIFRLKRDQWRLGKGPQTLEAVVTLSWPSLLPNTLPFGRPTAMDIAPDGKRFLILTYVEAAEFFFDLSKPLPPVKTWKEGQHYRKVALTTLEQEEAIAYLPDGKSFLYDTERAISSREARVMRVDCRP
jgi:hypothetical protein